MDGKTTRVAHIVSGVAGVSELRLVGDLPVRCGPNADAGDLVDELVCGGAGNTGGGAITVVALAIQPSRLSSRLMSTSR